MIEYEYITTMGRGDHSKDLSSRRFSFNIGINNTLAQDVAVYENISPLKSLSEVKKERNKN